MRSSLLVFALLWAVAGAQSAADKAHDAKSAALKQRAAAALSRERAHQQGSLCPKAMTTVDMVMCIGKQAEISDGNYKELVLALGALLRLDPPDTPNPMPAKPGGRIPFDDAESAWVVYRQKACLAVREETGDGTMAPADEMGCQMSLTYGHMKELAEVYKGLAL